MKKNTCSIIVFLLLSLPAFSAVNILFNPSEGNWNVPGNWQLNRVPTSDDNPILSAGRTAIINSDVGECNVIFCGQSASTPRHGRIKMYADGKLSAPILILGRDEDNHGIFWLCGGELSLSSYLSVGDNDGGSGGTASGTLNLSAGSLKMTGTAPSYIGYKGFGKMIVSGNGIFYANDITVGESSGSEGSELKIIGGSVCAKNITLGTVTTSNGKMIIPGGSLIWSNLFYVRDTLTIQNGSASINGVQSGGTALYLDNNSTLEFELGADGISAVKMTNSQINITSGAKLNISGTYYTRASSAIKSFLLIKHNGYADQTNFTSANVSFSGFGGLIPSLRYENNCIYLDLAAGSGYSARSAQGLFMKYWELPINDDAPWNRGYQKIVPPIYSIPLFTSTLVRTHPTFGKRVEKIDLSEALKTENFFVQFEGYIDIQTAGNYTFYLNSDDGSKLWIDDSLLIDNDGQHGETEVSASITFTKGMHKFEVGYFQDTGPMILSASWSGPGISKQEIPENIFYISDVKNAFSELRAFHNIIPDQELIYNYCPSFMYDDEEGLYKIWSGGSESGGDYIVYKESPTLEGLLDSEKRFVLSPSHDHSKFDDVHACDPNVFCVSGTFYLSYSGNTDGSDLPVTTRIGMAISYDRGRSWARLHNGVHILAPSPDYTYGPNNYGVGQSAAVRADDGYFYMIYTDVDNFRTGQKTFLRVIRCSDPAFPTNKHQMINSNVPNTGGVSLDLAYNSKNEEFIVIANVSDDPDVIEDPYAKVRISYYDKNWNYLRSRTIQVHPLWAFGEGVALLSDLQKQPFHYSDHGTPALVNVAATCEYETNTTLWAEWVAGDTKYLVTSLSSHRSFINPQLLSEGLFFNSNRTDVITTGLRPDIKNNFTVDLWAKPYTDTSLLSEQTNGTIGTTISSFAVRPVHGGDASFLPNSAGVGFAVGMNGFSVYEHGGGYAPPLLTWGGGVFDWTHFTVVYSNQTPYLYINGQFVRKGLQSPKDNSYITIDYFGGDVWGNYGYGGNLWNYRVWTRALTETEIETLPGTLAEKNIPSPFYGKWLQDNPINEGSPLGTKVFNVVTSGGNDNEIYHTYLSDNAGNRFAIEPINGEISVLKGNLIDYENASSHTVTVCSANNESTLNNRKFIIDVANISMNPRFEVELNCTYFDGNSFTNSGVTITNVENNFTVSFYAKPEKSIVIPEEATNGIAGLDTETGYAIAPQHGSDWGDENIHAGVGVSVGTNGIAVYEYGAGYMPPLLAWKSDTSLTDWMQISIVYSNKTPELFVNGIKMKTGLTSSKTVHPSAKSFGGASGLGYYKGKFTEYRVQSEKTTQSEIRSNMETWDINSIANYKGAFLPELIVTNGDVNGSMIGSLSPYVDLLTDPKIFDLTVDAEGRFNIGAADGIIKIEDITKFSYDFASNHIITARLTSGSKTYQKNITIHIAEDVIPEPSFFILSFGLWFLYFLRKNKT